MIIYNGKNSEKDFNIFVDTKEIPTAERKEITETVPHMSGLWDFSFNADGVDEYEPVTLKYNFDVIAATKQELNRIKTALTTWLHIKTDGRLYDSDFSFNEYWEVYRARAAWSEDGLQGLLTAEFLCYPFRKTEAQEIKLELTEAEQSIVIENTGFRETMPIIEATNSATLTIGTKSYAVGAGTYNGGVITLKRGVNNVKVKGAGTLIIKHWAEVL